MDQTTEPFLRTFHATHVHPTTGVSYRLKVVQETPISDLHLRNLLTDACDAIEDNVRFGGKRWTVVHLLRHFDANSYFFAVMRNTRQRTILVHETVFESADTGDRVVTPRIECDNVAYFGTFAIEQNHPRLLADIAELTAQLIVVNAQIEAEKARMKARLAEVSDAGLVELELTPA